MKKYLPTYEECVEICDRVTITVRREDEENPSIMTAFSAKEHDVDGNRVVTFNYGLFTSWSTFHDPIPENPELSSYELRGIAFLEKEDGSWERFLVLPKFFNLNQYEPVQYGKVKHLKVVQVQEKKDGSMLSFIRIGDKLYPRTKGSFKTPQVDLTNDFLDLNPNYRDFINSCL